jgi:hypothetical protein
MCVVLKFGHFGKYIRNTWKFLKCGAGKGWIRSVEPIVWKKKKHYRELRKKKDILQTLNRRNGNWICHILRRKYLLKHVIEAKIEVTGRRRERRRKQLLVYLKEKRRLWKLEEEALYRTVWRTGLGRCYGPVVRQTAK